MRKALSFVKQQQRHMFPWYVLLLICVASDQISKWFVLQNLEYAEHVKVIKGFYLNLAYNQGIAFGFFNHEIGWAHLGLFAMMIAIVVYLYWWLLSILPKQKSLAFAITLILGGAIGNLIDRVMHGHVVDFILVYIGNWPWPNFNIADSFICVGAALIIIDFIFSKEEA